MMCFNKKWFFITSPFLLNACSSGGGSFDVDTVSKDSPTPSKKQFKDEESQLTPVPSKNLSALQSPTLGTAMKLKAHNLFDRSGKENLFSEEEYETLDFNMIKARVAESTADGSIVDSNDGSSPYFTRLLKYVRSGVYYNDSWRERDIPNKRFLSGFYGYAFYFGENPSRALPVEGNAHYKGTWDFITNVKNGRTYPLLGSQAGNKRSAVPNDIDDLLTNKNDAVDPNSTDFGLSSEFDVNFGNKTLTGQLYRNKRQTLANSSAKKEKVYDLNATLHGNRFIGNAVATDKISQDYPFTSDAKDALEGGFYGPHGEELGGKFLTDDKRVFTVFSAKRNDESLTAETQFDAKQISFSAVGNGNVGDDFNIKDTTTFGEVNYLVVGNQRLPLLASDSTTSAFTTTSEHHVKENTAEKTIETVVCCQNLNSVKFGLYYDKDDKERKQYHQFLIGQRSSTKEIEALKGPAFYRGTWDGYITNGETSYTASATNKSTGDIAEFTVNFDNKTLTGELKKAGSLNTVFDINGKLDGNSFSGTASTKGDGFALDTKNTLDSTKVRINTEVKGAFYGAKGSELGGAFSANTLDDSNKAKAAVVFGAKRQVEVTAQ